MDDLNKDDTVDEEISSEFRNFIKNEISDDFTKIIEILDEKDELKNWTPLHLFLGFNAGIVKTYKLLRENITKELESGTTVARNFNILFVIDAAEKLGYDEIIDFCSSFLKK